MIDEIVSGGAVAGLLILGGIAGLRMVRYERRHRTWSNRRFLRRYRAEHSMSELPAADPPGSAATR